MRSILTVVLGAASVAGIAYTALAIARVRAFGRSPKQPARDLPPITVLKPLHGDEPDLYENLRSFCDQEYPDFQIVFTAADCNDEAIAHAHGLKGEFSNRAIDVVCGNAVPAANPKIGNLWGAFDRARHDIIVIADSDIRVGRDYLATLAADFDNESIGCVTCLYGGRPNLSLVSKLGAMHVNDEFAPSVLVAQMLEPLTYCFGATMAVRREALERAGGLAALADHLGDDYVLGQRVSAAGYRIRLSRYVVRTGINDATPIDLWKHELRWARTILAQRPAGYAGSVVTFVLPLAALLAVAAPWPIGVPILGLATVLRTMLHAQAKATFAPEIRATPWLIPLRDIMSVALWAAAFLGRGVSWRSGDYHLQAGGRVAGGPNGM